MNTTDPNPQHKSVQVDGQMAGRVNLVESGPWHHFLYGDTSKTDFERAVKVFRDRVVVDSGAADQLANIHAITWFDLSSSHAAIMIAEGEGAGTPAVDVAALTMRTQARSWERERTYARVTPRRLTAGLTGLTPDEIGALRSALSNDSFFRDDRRMHPDARFGRVMASMSATASYLASPHFIPPDVALDVVTTAQLDQGSIDALRLPAQWSLLFHEPVSISVAEADDDGLATLIDAGHCHGQETAIIGGLLAAHPDHTLDTHLGWLMITGINDAGNRFWNLQPAAYGPHAAGRVLYSYAAQLAFADWLSPPDLDEPRESAKPDSAKSIKRTARTEAARNGGFHHVRVLDYTPPPDEPPIPSDDPAGDVGTALAAGTWRRAFWKPGTRIGIRDEAGRLVGPVYRTGVEGETFTRERRFFRRARVRPDLPLREETTVYKIARPRAGAQIPSRSAADQ